MGVNDEAGMKPRGRSGRRDGHPSGSSDSDGVDGSDSWRLPSGKALAEFALQAGFLAPLMLGTPAVQEAKKTGAADESRSEAGKSGGGAGTIRQLSRDQMTVQVWIAILVGLAATIDDLRAPEDRNWIPAAALAGGFGWQIGQDGWHGALYALGGAAAGFGVFLIFYLLGGMGGGDVKLMAGFGALLGTERLLGAALLTAGVGGVLALGVLAFRRHRRCSIAGEGAGSE